MSPSAGATLAQQVSREGPRMPVVNDFETPGFSVKTAYYLAKASQAAYLDKLGDSIVELALGEQASTFRFDQFHGFVANLQGAFVLAFRGTEDIANWLTDGHLIQIEDPDYPGKVHRGFAGA